MWLVCRSLLHNTSARARVAGSFSESWAESAGVRQGAILSPLEFLVYIDDLFAAISAATPGVPLGPSTGAPRIRVLLYADDIAILAASEGDLHLALAALERWAEKWRLSFGLGNAKSAVVSFWGGPSAGRSPFELAGCHLEYVPSYKYLGVQLDQRLRFQPHFDELLDRSRCRFFACCGWARREHLRLQVLVRIVEAYVAPAGLYASELACDSPACMARLDRAQRWLGRILLQSGSAPNAVVLGDLGWRPWSSQEFERAVGLLSRVLCSRPGSLLSCVAQFALNSHGSWANWVAVSLRALNLDISQHLAPGSPPGARSRFLRHHVRPLLEARDFEFWRSSLLTSTDAALLSYGCLVARPCIASVHSPRTSPSQAAAWGRLRSGSSRLAAHRAPPHSLQSSQCALCGAPVCDTWHLLVACPALSDARAIWWASIGSEFRGQAPGDIPAAELLAFVFCNNSPPGVAAAHASFAAVCEARYPLHRPARTRAESAL